jgi:hypothetical protein
MGIRLIVEILDHAPAELTSAERLVLLAIAEDANDATRRGWPPIEVIADRCGLSVDSVQDAIQRLRRRGYDVRVPRKTGKDGRPVYAWRGRSTTYAVPRLPQRDGPGAKARVKGRENSPTLSAGKGGDTDPERVGVSAPKGGAYNVTPSPHIPSVPSSPRTRERDLLAASGAADDEIDEILETIRVEHPEIRSIGAWLTAVADNGGLAPIIADAWEQRTKAAWPAERDAFTAELVDYPPCVHGEPGGNVMKPDGINVGWMVCVGCRINARRSA